LVPSGRHLAGHRSLLNRLSDLLFRAVALDRDRQPVTAKCSGSMDSKPPAPAARTRRAKKADLTRNV